MTRDRTTPDSPEVAFVVPTRNNAATIGACVRSCVGQRGVRVEVIVVDNHSDDGTGDIARDAGCTTLLVAGPERSAQRNLGVSVATAPIVAIIDSDMTVSPGLAAELVAVLQADEQMGAVVIPELAVGEGWWQEARKLEKRLYLGAAEVEAARGFRVEAFTQVGGYDEDLVGAEDWDLPDRVRDAGWRLGRVDAVVLHHETVDRLRDLFRKKRTYGHGVAAYRARAGGRARPLVRTSLLARPGMLLRRPRAAAVLVGLKVVEAAGVFAGMAEYRLRAGRS